MSKLKSLTSGALSVIRPGFSRGFAAFAGLYALVQLSYIGVVLYKHEFGLFEDPTVALYFAEKLVFDFAVLFTLVSLLSRVTRRTWPSHALSVLYLLLVAVDTVMYYFGSTLLELHHLSLITGYSVGGFASAPALGFAAAFVLIAISLRFPLLAVTRKATWGSVARWGAVWIAMAATDLPELVAGQRTSDERLDKVIMVFRNAQLEYSAQNPAASFFNDIVLRGVSEHLYTMKGGEKYREFMKSYDLVSDDYQVSADLSEHAKVRKEHRLPIGRRSYPDLGLPEFRKVILIFVESLSTDFLSCENEELGMELTPFLCSPRVRSRTFPNLLTSGSPTLQGLTVVFSSHPNYNIQALTHDRNAFPKLLKRHGYGTMFLRSASKFFANENLIFKRWGFDLIYAREDFYDREEMRKYIYGWGLEDRLLYDELVTLLKERKDERLFVSLLGTDTHPLNGQRWFKHLEYPPLPAGFDKKFGRARHFAKAVHHADHDLGRLVGRLEDEGLFTDDTLLLITADHSCPPNSVTAKVGGHTRQSLGRIPLVVLTKRALPPVRGDLEASQLDVAPTLFHLLGLPIPAGWWGQSLFLEDRDNPAIGLHKDMVTLSAGGKRRLFNLKRDDEATREFEAIFSTVYVDQP